MSYFKFEEFKCKCGQCKSNGREMNADFLTELNKLRDAFGRLMIISSGYRCPDHNAKVSSTGRDGAHTTGKACDILIQGDLAYQLVKLAIGMGFTGIGINQKGNGRFVHLDILSSFESIRPRIWSY